MLHIQCVFLGTTMYCSFKSEHSILYEKDRVLLQLTLLAQVDARTVGGQYTNNLHAVTLYTSISTAIQVMLFILIMCIDCRLQYIGHTTQKLKCRIRKHLSDIPHSQNRNVSSVSPLFADVHGGNYRSCRVQGVKRVYLPVQGGDFKRKLLNRETLWMFRLNPHLSSWFEQKAKHDCSLLILLSNSFF